MKTFKNTKNLLKKKFIEGVKKDYNNHLEQFITSLSIMTKEDLEEDIQYILDDIPLTSTVLSWVKTNIIDYGEILLNKYRCKDTDKNEAIYYVNKEDLAILMESNFIRTVEINIIMHYININTLGELFNLTIENFSNYFIDLIDRTNYATKRGE